MLQNARVTAFTVSKLLRENQQGEGVKLRHPPPRLGLRKDTSPESSPKVLFCPLSVIERAEGLRYKI